MQHLICLFLLLACIQLGAQDFAAIDQSVMDAAYYPSQAPLRSFAKTEEERLANEPKIRVLYSRPLKKERTIFGDLLQYGEPWRVGANESTEVLFMQDVKFGEQVVPAGRYTMIVIPGEDSWTVNLNTELDGWGNFSYDPEWDLASVTVPVQTSDEVIEAVSMALYEASPGVVHLKMGWDTSYVEVPITL
ncbi:hypothetical protein LEM8419_01041 [Neolewinella maritima]|uniref:DUF2911 domain-containing protein n=1 Tax=Neolewinella maritima TaxID=1383882 RepID=A0ABM9AYP6_9BACT|nr:DUF2911 domain-containing protein [Neolewinella maritima]CAH0999741.1 hypothetical protein LEM8419_01041 [Neolewinella maritima]